MSDSVIPSSMAVDSRTLKSAATEQDPASLHGAGVIALVPDEWDAVVMPRHQVLSRLAKHLPVVWLEPARNWREFWRPFGPFFLAPDRVSLQGESLRVYSAGWRRPLVHRPRWLSRFFLRSRLEFARRLLLQMNAKRVILYVWRDEFADALDCVDYDICCYHVDDDYSFSDLELPNSARELKVLQRADQVIVHSTALLRKKGGINANTALVPNGVDYSAFSKSTGEPEDLALIPHPRVGYAGVIKKQLDLALLVRLAIARPGYSFVFVGPQLNISGKEEYIEKLRTLPNVHFLGGKPAGELPAYIQHFDACLLCYEVNNYTNHIYPLKLNEYLATGKPAIASPIETVKGLDIIKVASSDDEWLAALDETVREENRTAAVVQARQEFARLHDWDGLVDRIAHLFQESLQRTFADHREA